MTTLRRFISRIRFSLRTLLLASVLLGGMGAWYAAAWWEFRAEAEVMRIFVQVHGYEDMGRPHRSGQFFEKNPHWFVSETQNVLGFELHRKLVLGGWACTDSHIDHIVQLSHLETLYLVDTSITPQGLQRIRQLLPGVTLRCMDLEAYTGQPPMHFSISSLRHHC
ncbi:MAG: hypothetical protein AMXMBFR7_34060 [Planctomycetota bacterium]